jgi:ribosomal protein S18 acetylase RimI-like enzyme
MKLVRWKRFTWDLSQLPAPAPALAERYTLRPAFGEDQEAVEKLVLAAFTLDAEWSVHFRTLPAWLKEQLDQAFDRENAPAVVITHGLRIIAASAITTEVDAETHLISGPCVSMEYRNRGLGTALLHGTLAQLRQAGLRTVHGVTKENVPTAKFIYPKFGAVAVEHDFTALHART